MGKRSFTAEQRAALSAQMTPERKEELTRRRKEAFERRRMGLAPNPRIKASEIESGLDRLKLWRDAVWWAATSSPEEKPPTFLHKMAQDLRKDDLQRFGVIFKSTLPADLKAPKEEKAEKLEVDERDRNFLENVLRAMGNE